MKVYADDALVINHNDQYTKGSAICEGIFINYSCTVDIASILAQCERPKGNFTFDVMGKDSRGNLIAIMEDAAHVKNSPKKER